MTPKISIVVPVYRTEAFIAQCIQSLINQTLKDIEIILVDDGSPDKAGEICDRFALDDSRVKVYHQKNAGGCVAMWKGAHYATAEYLMYLDGDDWVEYDTCEKAYNSIINEKADIVFWSHIKEFPDGDYKKQESIFQESKIFIDDDLISLKKRFIGLTHQELQHPTRTDAFSSCWGKLYKRSLIVEDPWCIIDKEGNHNFDVLINIRLFKNALKVIYLKEYFNHYRQYNPHSATKTHKLLLLDKYLVLFDNIQEYITENSLGDGFQEALHNRIALSVINNALSVTSPNLSIGRSSKVYQLRKVLHHQVYVNALKNFELAYLPIYWKLFFLLAKGKMAKYLYFTTLLIRILK